MSFKSVSGTFKGGVDVFIPLLPPQVIPYLFSSRTVLQPVFFLIPVLVMHLTNVSNMSSSCSDIYPIPNWVSDTRMESVINHTKFCIFMAVADVRNAIRIVAYSSYYFALGERYTKERLPFSASESYCG